MASSNLGDYEKKLLEMRLQMQENQAYMHDAFSDIEKWTQEIKEKEKKLAEDPNSVKNTSKGLPPIRNLATTKKKKKKRTTNEKKEEEKKQQQTGKSKINSYDYRAWDKLDIDKMCEDVDNKKTSSSEYTTDEEWEEEQRLTRAEWEKERGNQFFKDNMLDEAIECYTRASNLNPNNAVYVSNRAMCYLKQNRYAQAEVDCNVALALDPNYPKAYHRRATARLNLGKLEEARRDFEQLLRLEPHSKLAQIEINKIENALEKSNLVFAVVKKESERSKKPLVRIKIEDINVEETSTERAKIKQELKTIQEKIKLSEKEEQLFNVTNESSSQPKEAKSQTKIEKPTKTDDVKTTPTKVIPECPNNGYQFKKDWQYLCNNLENLATYLKKIPPIDYPKLFLNGLESDNLAKMLDIFNRFFKNDQNVNLFESMKYLTQIKRFQTQLMFLTQADKKNLDEIFAQLNESKNIDKEELEKLIKLFKS